MLGYLFRWVFQFLQYSPHRPLSKEAHLYNQKKRWKNLRNCPQKFSKVVTSKCLIGRSWGACSSCSCPCSPPPLPVHLPPLFPRHYSCTEFFNKNVCFTQRHRDRPPSTPACPDCWAEGTNKVKMCAVMKKIICTGLTRAAKQDKNLLY